MLKSRVCVSQALGDHAGYSQLTSNPPCRHIHAESQAYTALALDLQYKQAEMPESQGMWQDY